MQNNGIARQDPSRSFRSFRSIGALVLREMSATNSKSLGGYFWEIVESVAAILLLAAVFSLLLRSPSLGTNFQIFYATGFLPYTLYNTTASKVARAIHNSRSLLFYQSVCYSDAIFARFMVNFITNVIIFILIVLGLFVTYDLNMTLDIQSIMYGIFLAAFLGLGIAVLNCYLVAVVPYWGVIWTVINRPLFILSTVIYAFEDVPVLYRDWLWYNPLIHVIGMVRRGFYSTYDATYVSPIYVITVSIICLCAGLLLLNIFVKDILNK